MKINKLSPVGKSVTRGQEGKKQIPYQTNSLTPMKRLKLHDPGYKLLEHSFQDWLITLNYSGSAIQTYPVLLRELFFWLEQQGQTDLQALIPSQVETFFVQWQQRKNQRSGAGLSVAYINTMANTLICFVKYLKVSGEHTVAINLKRPQEASLSKTILSQQEISMLYQACDVSHPLGLRDQAMLAVYYGCGLRKNEGNQLEVTDIHLQTSLLHVRAGKLNQERYVPVTKQNLQIIQDYLAARDWFLYRHSVYLDKYDYRRKKPRADDQAFFVNIFGMRMYAFGQRLALLKEASGIEKSFSLHNLRHSIATHLLQAGMSLPSIAQFLGHRCLESTQIYTHILDEYQNQDQPQDQPSSQHQNPTNDEKL